MTRYAVVWEPSVESAFTAYWVASDPLLRINLTEIANWIDTNLSVDPETKGRVRADLEARIVPVPLSFSNARVSATFEVWPEDRIVRVIRLTIRGW